MGCGCNSINNTCGEHHYAACTFYEGALPAFTTLTAQDCYTIEEVIADIYQIETGIKDEIDLSGLLTNGITYTLVDGAIITKNALARHAELILSLQDQLTELLEGTDETFDITAWKLDFGCIADNCDNPPNLLKDLIQLMIIKICELETRVTDLETP